MSGIGKFKLTDALPKNQGDLPERRRAGEPGRQGRGQGQAQEQEGEDGQGRGATSSPPSSSARPAKAPGQERRGLDPRPHGRHRARQPAGRAAEGEVGGDLGQSVRGAFRCPLPRAGEGGRRAGEGPAISVTALAVMRTRPSSGLPGTFSGGEGITRLGRVETRHHQPRERSLSENETPVATVGGRLAAVDALRGMVMVLMVLDHTRDFFTDMRVDATDPATSTLPLFFTRWVTHFCAPLSSSSQAHRRT